MSWLSTSATSTAKAHANGWWGPIPSCNHSYVLWQLHRLHVLAVDSRCFCNSGMCVLLWGMVSLLLYVLQQWCNKKIKLSRYPDKLGCNLGCLPQARALFEASEGAPHLLGFYSRVAASLAQVFPDVAAALLRSLEEEFALLQVGPIHQPMPIFSSMLQNISTAVLAQC